MKPHPESQPPPQDKADVVPGSNKPKPAIEPPTQPFINLSGDGPVDPSKFQRFIVPMEFIEKANAVELPRLGPEDLMDTGQQKPLVVPEKSASSSQGVKHASSHSTMSVDEDEKTPTSNTGPNSHTQDTIRVLKRRPSGLIPREMLDGAHTRAEQRRSWWLWALWGTVGVVALLIWFWSHGKDGGDVDAVVNTQSSAALPAVASVIAAVPSTPAPMASSGTAQAVPDRAPVTPETLPDVVDIDSPETTPKRALRTGEGSVGSMNKNSGAGVTRPKVPEPAPAVPSSAPAAPTTNGIAPVFRPE